MYYTRRWNMPSRESHKQGDISGITWGSLGHEVLTQEYYSRASAVWRLRTVGTGILLPGFVNVHSEPSVWFTEEHASRSSQPSGLKGGTYSRQTEQGVRCLWWLQRGSHSARPGQVDGKKGPSGFHKHLFLGKIHGRQQVERSWTDVVPTQRFHSDS